MLKTSVNASARSTAGQARSPGCRARLGLCFLLPFLMGGCPEFRNDVVSVLEAATRSALLGAEDAASITDTATTSLVGAAIDLFFDPLRADSF